MLAACLLSWVLRVCVFKQKTAYEMRISDWSSDVCSSDLVAQDVTGGAPAAASGESEAIVVTGTRIRRPNLDSNSPMTVVSDEEFSYQGATTVESVLNRLPQFTADANENVSNG